MKFLVLSDTHHVLSTAFTVLDKIGKGVDGVIHLGDTIRDADSLMNKYTNLTFHNVRGNCDPLYSGVSDSKILLLNGKRIFVTHGDKYNVKWGIDRLYYASKEKEVAVVLFGHTHIPYIEYYEDILFMNPGSISEPRLTKKPTYGILDISDTGDATGSIIEVINNNTFAPVRNYL